MARQTKTTKPVEPEVLPCTYAGDAGDEYCCSCNGITMTFEGRTFPCTECQSYQAPAQVEPQPEPQLEQAPEQVVETFHTAESDTEQVTQDTYTSKAVTVSIKAESGLSVELKNVNGGSEWYKFSYAEERVVPDGCDIEKEKELLWADVNAQIDAQYNAVVNN